MNTNELATRLVELNRSGDTETLLNELYDPACVSVEPMEMMPGMGREASGLEAIKAKHAFWEENTEMHEMSVEGPFPHGEDRFAVIFEADITMKAIQQRTKSREVALYTVKEGRVVREEFFYGA